KYSLNPSTNESCWVYTCPVAKKTITQRNDRILFFGGICTRVLGLIIIRRKSIELPPQFEPNGNILQKGQGTGPGAHSYVLGPGNIVWIGSQQQTIFAVWADKCLNGDYFAPKSAIGHVGPTAKDNRWPTIKLYPYFFPDMDQR